MTKQINIPMWLTGGEKTKCFITNENKVVNRLLNTSDYIIIYHEKIFNIGSNYILISNTISLYEAYNVLKRIEEREDIKLPYKVNSLLEIGCFDSEIKWAV